MLNKAFQLAYFIIGEKEAAKEIASAALARLPVAVAAQDKRLYYLPTGRGKGLGKARTKVSLSDSQLLQRLVYLESEKYEMRQETSAPLSNLSEDDMMIRYIKHLVKITLPRNSFYVTVGLSRLLYSYTTNETMQIYTFLTQDRNAGPDDDKYRHRKKGLLADLKQRFAGLVETSKGSFGEERFEPHPDQSRFLKLVDECLRKFTPWDTGCVLPGGFDPGNDDIPDLIQNGYDPDAGHQTEINRMHTMIHPVCFAKMVTALNLEEPEGRLALPKFLFAANADSDSPGDYRPPAHLNDEELTDLKDDLDREGRRRREAPGGQLRICVDGRERARINPEKSSRVSIQITEEDEVIEVWGRDQSGPLLLAALLLSGEDFSEDERRAAVILEGDQRISFALHPDPIVSDAPASMTLEVMYRQDGWLGWLKLWRDHLSDIREAITGNKRKLILSDNRQGRPRLRSPLVALAGLALFFALTYSIFFEFISKQGNEPADEAGNQTTPSQTPIQESARKAISPADSTSTGEAAKGIAIKGVEQQPPAPVLRERELSQSAAGNVLESVTDIFIQIEGQREGIEQEKKAVHSAVVKAILGGHHFTVAEHESVADAILRIEIQSVSLDGRLKTVAKLIKNGQVIWPLVEGVKGSVYEGPIESIGSKIIQDLTTESTKGR